MGEIMIGAIFGILLGICIFGVIDIEKQIRKTDKK
jgi:hypothetical protein